LHKLILLVLCFGVLPGCFHDDESIDNTAEAEKYSRNLQIWLDANITDYQFTYHENCFCMPQEDLIIQVQNSTVASAFYAQSGEYVANDQLGSVPAIDDLFAVIKDALDRNAYEINSTYHADYGFPQHIYIDYLKNAVDEEFGFTVSDFQ